MHIINQIYTTLLLERIVIQTTLLIVLGLFAALGNRHHALHLLPVGRRQQLVGQRALDWLRYVHLENVPAHDVNVAAILLLHLLNERGRCIELHQEVAAGAMDQTMLADFVRQRSSAQVLQLANDAAVVEDFFGGPLEGGDHFGLPWYSIGMNTI